MLSELIEKAEKKGSCLRKNTMDGKVLIYPGYYLSLVKSAYEGMEGDNERPFPGEEALGVTVPEESVQVLDVKANFVDLLRGEKKLEKQLIRLTFPEGIHSMLIIPELAKVKILDLSISKMRQYLTIKKNVDYINHRLLAAFPGKDRSIKDMISNILTQRDTALAIIKDPDDFSFQVWSHFMSVIMKDFREKETKLERDHAFAQAIYLIGMYNLFYKGNKRSKQEREKALQVVENGLKNRPYFHTFLEISGFKDPKGFPVTRTIKQKELAAWLEKRTELHSEGPMPDIIRLRDAAGHEYFIAKEKLLQLTLKKVLEEGRAIRTEVARDWSVHLGEFRKVPEMNRREALEADLWRRVKNRDPLLFALLKFELLMMTLQETKPSQEVYIETERLFDAKKTGLIPIDEILRFDRKSVLLEARTMIPLWKSIPIIGRLGVFLIHLFKGVSARAANIKDPSEVYSQFSGGDEAARRKSLGKRKIGQGFKTLVAKDSAEEPTLGGSASSEDFTGDASGTPGSGESKKQQLQRYRDALEALKKSYVGDSGNLETDMKKLIYQWNPLVDDEAKKNLVEDVNSMIRDFMRRLKRGFAVSPPDAERLRTLAEQVAETESLAEIKRKGPLTRYIELYMIQQLGKK